MSQKFDELQVDALCELMNVGVGAGAAGVGKMLGQEVLLAVPKVEVVPSCELIARVSGLHGSDIVCIQQTFNGDFSGKALLIFPGDKTARIVASLLAGEAVTDDDVAQDAMTEIGNVLINACLGSIGNMLNADFACRVPLYLDGQSERVLSVVCVGARQDQQVMLVHLNLGLPELDVHGEIVFMLAVGSFERLRGLIDDMLLGSV